LPWQIDGWSGRPGEALDRESIAVLGVDDFVNRVYTHAGEAPIAVYVGYYGSQRQGDTIHSPLNCLPGAGWQPIARTRLELRVRRTPQDVAERKIVVNRMTIEKGTDRAVVLYWYQGHGRVVASEYWGRALLAYDAFRLHRTDGALVRVIAPIAPDAPGAETASERSAIAFVRALFPALAPSLPD
jgi:EpsI family protein